MKKATIVLIFILIFSAVTTTVFADSLDLPEIDIDGTNSSNVSDEPSGELTSDSDDFGGETVPFTEISPVTEKAKTDASDYKVTLSSSVYVYDGKAKKPLVTVKSPDGKTVASSNYNVSYSSGRKKVGKYTVTIVFTGDYTGSIKKSFTIKPASTKITKITAIQKGFIVKWKKNAAQTDGYQIQYSTKSNFKKAKIITVSKNKTVSKTVKKLKKSKKYYVRVRTYKTANGTKYYSAWSSKKTVKTKK